MKNDEKRYMVLLNEKTLEIKMLPFEDGIKPLYNLIKCDAIDHASAIDALNEVDIDMWVDDEGLLKSRSPVFMFLDDDNNVQGQIVGNVVFQKSNAEGESYGMTEDEAYGLMEWIDSHEEVLVELYNGDINSCFVVRPHETVNHRKKMEDLRRMAIDNGWQVFNV